jgi:hypothetical protein
MAKVAGARMLSGSLAGGRSASSSICPSKPMILIRAMIVSYRLHD